MCWCLCIYFYIDVYWKPWIYISVLQPMCTIEATTVSLVSVLTIFSDTDKPGCIKPVWFILPDVLIPTVCHLPLSSTGPDCPRQAYPWGLSTQGRGEENNCLPLLVWLQNGTAWALEQGGGGSCGHFFNPAQQALCVSLAHSFHPQCSLTRESGCWHSCHITFNRLGMKKKKCF